MGFLKDPITFIANWFVGLLQNAGMSDGWVHFIGSLLSSFILALGSILFVIFLIWLERKVIGRFQDRFGPNRVGPWGLIQPFADMIKIFTKEYITPLGADWLPYNLAPIVSVAGTVMVWAVIPFTITVFGVDLPVGILYVMAVGALGELGFILAGWASNNKYALFGAIRSVAMLISYEVPMVITSLIPVMFAGSLSLNGIVKGQDVWFIVLAPVAALIFYITTIAEIGRAPFDLLEAESEIVAGFNIEYSGLKFGMFYVAEFLHAFTASFIFATLFLGGWRGPGAEQYPVLGMIYLAIKTFLVYFSTLSLKSTLPRLRIDQMMDLNWKVLTPMALVLVIVMSLADRIMVGMAPILRILVFIILNLMVLVVADRLITRRKPVLVEVGSRDRPVARPENLLDHPKAGAGG